MTQNSHHINRVLHPVVDFEGRDLYLHRRSQQHDPSVWKRYSGKIPISWSEIARQKGHRIHARLRDRNHLALQCLKCGALTAHRVFALRTSAVRCEQCASSMRQQQAESVGLTFVRTDPVDRHYAFYRAMCGHELRRQMKLLDRVETGDTGLRCEICLDNREKAEADERGWKRLGRDPNGDLSYRLYRHACGHEQRIAIVNMRHGQCDCANCGESWASKPSFLYIFRISIPENNFDVLKFGYSGRPDKRLKHQLGLPETAQAEVLRTVAIESGHLACRLEKQIHVRLKKNFPDSVVSPVEYADLMNVSSEIYSCGLLPVLERVLDRIERLLPMT